MASKMSSDDLDIFTCAVCKDVYKNPVKISCGHSFCDDCIKQSWVKISGGPTCPICRKTVHEEAKMNLGMMTEMSEKSTACRKCKKIVRFTEYRRHQRICQENARTSGATGRNPILAILEDVKPIVNIYTFVCPYCQAKNLDREGLAVHVNSQHKGDKTAVVCPICKAMPWGNPNQCSQNFPDHVNIRHKFDYERFVDLNQDENEALETTMDISTRNY